MKKIAVLLFSVVVALTASFSAFAASSPSGGEIADKFNIVVTVTKNDKAYSDVKLVLDDSVSKVTDSKGSCRFDDVTAGTHSIKVYKDTTLIDEVAINITKGGKTEAVKVSDDNFNITVKSGVSTVYINMTADDKDDITIKDADSVGNDSPDSPQTGDYTVAVLLFGLIASFVGVLVSGYYRKRLN